MGIITKEVQIEIKKNFNMKSYYKNLGYEFKTGDVIVVPIEDLPHSSRIIMDCTCDYCGKPIKKSYGDCYKALFGTVKKIACSDCHSKKNEESNLIKYGVKNPNQIPEVREKIRNTSRERYGADSPFQSEEIRKKIEESMMMKYGVKYPGQSQELQDKAKQTNMIRYGSTSPFSRDSTIYNELQEKTKQTSLLKYGVENPMQNPSIKQKAEQTCLEKYGSTNPFGSSVVQDKIKQTMIERYGTDNPMKCQEIKERAYQTNYERYGVEHILQSPDIMAKMISNNMNKYGVEYVSQLPEVRKKAVETMYNNQSMCTSKQQKYIAQLYNMVLNYPILSFSIDMYDETNCIGVEYDGKGHDLSIVLKDETEERFNNKELVREKLIRQDGHKLIRIISRTDYLPSDTILLQMLSDAKQYFSDYPNHSWITFDIDEGIVKNAECKNGRSYFYGQLRRIKKSDLESA